MRTKLYACRKVQFTGMLTFVFRKVQCTRRNWKISVIDTELDVLKFSEFLNKMSVFRTSLPAGRLRLTCSTVLVLNSLMPRAGRSAVRT